MSPRSKREIRQGLLEDAQALLQQVIDDLQDAQDNTPENLQGSEAYERRGDAIDALETAVSEIGGVDL